MDKQVIPFNKPFVVGKELFYIAQAVMNGGIAGDGHFSRLCHQWLESNLGCHKALLTHSCTAALEMAAILADVGPGDEVIMPSFTFVSTANAFVLRGAIPVFVDIRQDSLNLDERLVEAAITERTKAIVAVHYAGQPCDMDALMRICEKHGLMLIEDAAQAILARQKTRALGTIGHLGCLSFHETKNVISGEGGALLINDPKLIERAEIIWQKGTNRKAFARGEVSKYTWVDVGSSFLPSELTAAFLYAQLEQGESINDHRRSLYEAYYNQLGALEVDGCFTLPRTPGGKPANAHIFYVLMRSSVERDALIRFLREREIYAVFHYVPLHDSPAGLRFSRSVGELPITRKVSDCLVRLPLFSDMAGCQVDEVCAAIQDFFTQLTSA
ncbi:dTDP-4-amino-4,6-dideoxygalactose transaminase [Pseudomonas sp. BIGb0278]|uniref:dTDP-4-amino-4,6-dideoxygalactose transaminase n=1 Tax=Pseudomonas TaxID=286 RepID=UPI0015E3D421|nr:MULTISPECIES: dTDP-4-amino-4,6-dideoxygalactose transaminase [Pseudomonas]MBA1322225.1 dTDP-4-amino-4,6-dideoxygalactose transaminase [Pseudomonas plecoglossicida]MCS4285710.1 dTDP-4-amino-4,6-dideoxygalactose transaminase [Pseudomonas sp. BIGb0278]QYX53225.1 dTDP-4-amino-4,6-dideoxygalactose transaminase [Pseudomonas sp. S07E 245]